MNETLWREMKASKRGREAGERKLTKESIGEKKSLGYMDIGHCLGMYQCFDLIIMFLNLIFACHSTKAKD